ncbi:MAG: MarR family winged helix-turn-helix transcriptional regulator [Gemmatimonadaceae bacterium]
MSSIVRKPGGGSRAAPVAGDAPINAGGGNKAGKSRAGRRGAAKPIRSGQATQALLALVYAGRAVEERLEGALRASGLSLAKLKVLTFLVESGRSLALSEIADKLNCVRSNVTQLIDRLEGDGLVRRLYDPGDRRTVLAEISELGRDRQSQGAAALARAQKEIALNLSPSDLQELGRLSHAVT